MYILAIETTGPHCSAALIDDAGNVTEKRSGGTLNHLQNLMPMTKELLEDCKLQIDDVTAIAASCGPGSFTGIRIGVATARALCQAAGKPAIAVPTLKSFAYHLEDADCASSGGRLRIAAPMFDARRNQVYGGAYVMCASSGGKIDEVVRGGAYMLDEFLELLADALGAKSSSADEGICASGTCASADCGLTNAEVIFYGDGCEKYGETTLEFCSAHGINAKICGETQKASSVARLALDMYKAGELLEYGQLHPEYMRKAEAERKLEEKKRAEAEAAK